MDTPDAFLIEWDASTPYLVGSPFLGHRFYGGHSGGSSGSSLSVSNSDGVLRSLSNAVGRVRSIMVWDSEDFIEDNLRIFDSSASSSFFIEFGAYENPHQSATHFIIRDGDDYYVSKEGVAGRNSSFVRNGTQLEWGLFDPADFDNFDATDEALGMSVTGFSLREFGNVTGVGLIGTARRPNNNPVIDIKSFVVTLAGPGVPTSPTYGNDGDLWTIPGWIEAENYDTGGPGVSYHDTSPGNTAGSFRAWEHVDVEVTGDLLGGHNVTMIEAGEWLQYSVNVTQCGYYHIVTRFASEDNVGNFRYLVDGVDVTGTISHPKTDGAQSWVDVASPQFYLEPGERTIRLEFLSGGFNVNWFKVMREPKAGDFLTARPEWAGVWANTFGRNEPLEPFAHLIAGEADRPQWRNIEPTKGNPDFSRIEATLNRCIERDYYYYAEIWSGHWHTAPWVYDNGVPEVHFSGSNDTAPYYLDENYIRHLNRFFKDFAEFLAGLSEAQRERIAFLQIGFGSTGDRQLYKDEPINSAYRINSEEYLAYMKRATVAWHAAFAAHPETRGIRFLWNVDDYDGLNPEQLDNVGDGRRGEMLYAEWMRRNYNVQFRKQQFTPAIGYMASNQERRQDEQQRAHFYGVGDPPRWNGNPEFIRGEHNDFRWAETPMAKKALRWHYYWTAIAGVDRGLDAWETHADPGEKYILSGNYNEAYAFATRHSFHKRGKTSPLAFVALRDVLDYSDAERFAGLPGSASRDSVTRINAILAQYAPYGAANEDTDAVLNLSGNRYLHDSKGLNDVVWQVIDRNYQRHMRQIDPHETSVGWWRVGSKDQPYGRFARAFEHESGKNALYFQFDDRFFQSPPVKTEITVIYFDEVAGSTWDLRYDNGGESLATAQSVTTVGDGEWKTLTVTLHDAVFNRNGPRGSDIALVNTDTVNNKFHLVEVRRADDFEAFAQAKGLVMGPDGDDDGDGFSNFYEFAMGGDPKDPSDQGVHPSLTIDPSGEGNFRFFMRQSYLSNLIYRIEGSDDLDEWTVLEEWSSPPEGSLGPMVDYPFLWPMEEFPKFFLRLTVEDASND